MAFRQGASPIDGMHRTQDSKYDVSCAFDPHSCNILKCNICISQGRASLTEEKEVFAHEHEEMKNLEAIVQKIKPTALIGKCFSTLFSFNLTYLALFCFLKILNPWNPEGK